MNDNTKTRVLAELTIDEASVLVGLARTQGLIELADKVQEAIMEAAENPVLAVKALELNKPDLVGTKDTEPVILAQAQTAAVDETANLSNTRRVGLTDADAEADANGTPRPDNPSAEATAQQQAEQKNSQLPLSTQTSASIAATSVLGGSNGQQSDSEGGEA